MVHLYHVQTASRMSLTDEPKTLQPGKIPWGRDGLPSPVFLGFPGGLAGKESTCKAGDLGSIPGLGKSPGKGNGHPLQYSGLENSTDCIVHGVSKLDTTERLSLSETERTLYSFPLHQWGLMYSESHPCPPSHSLQLLQPLFCPQVTSSRKKTEKHKVIPRASSVASWCPRTQAETPRGRWWERGPPSSPGTWVGNSKIKDNAGVLGCHGRIPSHSRTVCK